MAPPTLLIIDDERNVLYALEKSLSSESLLVITALTARHGLELVASEKPSAVILDVRLPDMSGLDAFTRLREIDPRLPVIIITAHGTSETAIEATKRGAYEYLVKPYDLRDLKAAVAGALELSRLSRVPAVFEQEAPVDNNVDRIVGASAAMQRVYKEIGRVAPQNVNVLILGESGTGKELVARAIYQHSRRAGAPFLAINCAAIPETLLESELFGHEKGAFTGAERQRIGKFEQAHQGTLFLDEIGDMSAATQAKVLRLLQDGRFERVGGNETIHSDVRIIAATNRDLEQAIASRDFRQDLYYRLNTFTIHLPPLRERREDIPRLAEYFTSRFGRKIQKRIRTISPSAMEALQSYDWPGNVRELESTLKYALVRTTGNVLTPESLPDHIQCRQSPVAASPTTTDDVRAFLRDLVRDGQGNVYQRMQMEVDRILFEEVFTFVQGNQVQAAELLGISRTTLRSRMQSLGLTVEKVMRPESGQDGQSLSLDD